MPRSPVVVSSPDVGRTSKVQLRRELPTGIHDAESFRRQLFDSDEATIATTGMVVSRGGVLYRDVIDRKPALAAMLYAATFWVTDTRILISVHTGTP